ncbi:unnamed protein product, partial [marine sediment metagenome]
RPEFALTSSFQVYRSFPAFNNFGLLINEWSTWAKSQVLASEIFPKDYDFAQLSKDAKTINQQTQQEAAARQNATLAAIPPNPLDPDDPKNKKKGLVVGSVAGKGKTAQSSVSGQTLGNLVQSLRNTNLTAEEEFQIFHNLSSQEIAAKALGTAGPASFQGTPLGPFSAKASSDPLRAGASVGTTATNANKPAAPSPFSKTPGSLGPGPT